MGCPARWSAPGARLFAQLELANPLQLSGAPRLSQTHPPSGSLSVIVLGQPRQVRARQIHRHLFWCCRRVMVSVPDEVCVSVCLSSLAWLGLGRAAGTIEVGVGIQSYRPRGEPLMHVARTAEKGPTVLQREQRAASETSHPRCPRRLWQVSVWK